MFRLAAIIGLSAALPGETAIEIGSVSEYQLKAAFLFNIARFVEWPQPEESGDEVSICILGKDPFGEVLDKITAGRRVRGKPIEVKRLRSGDDSKACQILFVSRSERRRLDRIVESVEGEAVLTVGDSAAFLSDGGMIMLEMNGPKLTFSVNLASVKRNEIYISSRLLALARSVER